MKLYLPYRQLGCCRVADLLMVLVCAAIILLLPLVGAFHGSGWALAVTGLLCVSAVVSRTHFPTQLFKQKISSVVISFCILYGFMIISFMLSPHYGGIIRLAELACCFVALIFGSVFSQNEKAMRYLRYLLTIALIFLLLNWVASKCPSSGFSAMWDNPNSFGFIMLCLSTVLLLAPAKTKTIQQLSIMIAGLLIFVSSSRSSLIAFLSLLLIRHILKNHPSSFNAKNITIAFLVVIGIILSFSVGYSMLYETTFGNTINELSLQLTGKSFYSGRQAIWSGVLEAIRERPLMGYGLHAMPGDFFDTTFSAHSLYLQTLLQSGLMGLFLHIALLATILRAVTENTANPNRWIVVAFVFAVALHEAFEVTLTQNAFLYGMSAWLIMGLGLRSHASWHAKRDSETALVLPKASLTVALHKYNLNQISFLSALQITSSKGRP